MFGRSRDVSLIRRLNRELMGNIITQQAAFYKYKLEETVINLYVKLPVKNILMVPFYLIVYY